MRKTLDVNASPGCKYAVPIWLRDLQIRAAIERVSGRIEPHPVRSEPVAIACFGPSLQDTWEQVKDYRYVFTGSGSHRFLIDRGIVPTWHAEVDPRAHKTQLLGEPHPEVEYLIASTCHGDLFDRLSGMNVKLWHVFSNEAESLRLLPRGEWAILGGSNIGLRQMTLARFLGFTEQHVFGMDGCLGENGSHAAAHPNPPPGYSDCEYGGTTYRTTPAMLMCAKGTFHELNQMPDVQATFYGEGLVQALAKDYVREPPAGPALIAFSQPELISAEYRELNARLHRENVLYGVGGARHAPQILKLMQTDPPPKGILDYGCIEDAGEVITEDGPRTIQWVVDNRYSGRVLSQSGDHLSWNRVVNHFKRESDGRKWVEWQTRHRGKLRPVVCTEDHECASIPDVLAPSVVYRPARELDGTYAVRMPWGRDGEGGRLYNSCQISALVGMVLGDGYLDKRGRYYGPHGISQKDYVEYKRAIFGGHLTSTFGGSSGFSQSECLMLHIPTTAQTQEMRRIYYPDGKRRVDPLIQYADERSLAFWYMDDGRLKWIFGKPYANIHTEGFRFEEVEKLQSWMESEWDLCASAYRVREGQYFLHLNQRSSARFFRMIAKHTHPSMRYKLPKEYLDTPLEMIPTDRLGIAAERVISVRPVDTPSLLYDIEVEGAHNFVVNRSVVHNCGKGLLGQELAKHGVPIWEYDPAIPGRDEAPHPAELTICTDVLEHIEPDKLQAVLKDLQRCVLRVGFFVIDTLPAQKTLADGRNTHQILKDAAWWGKKLSAYFKVAFLQKRGRELFVLVGPKGSS